MRLVLVLALAVAVAMAGCGGTDEPVETAAVNESPGTTASASTPITAAPAITVELSEENGSGQQGTATIAALDDGVSVTVDVNNEDGIGQFALIAAGSCTELGAPYADIFSQGVEVGGGQTDGTWSAERPLVFETGEPVALPDLEAGGFAVVVIDKSYRGGILEEIPDDVHLLDPPDSAGPYGEAPYPLAACGNLPSG